MFLLCYSMYVLAHLLHLTLELTLLELLSSCDVLCFWKGIDGFFFLLPMYYKPSPCLLSAFSCLYKFEGLVSV